MAVSGDVTLAPDAETVKIHPYVVAVVRWCVSYVWSMATVLVHRIMTNPGQSVKAIKPAPVNSIPRRAIQSSHIHPEPKVECVVLHQPKGEVEMDFVFVHGLYGSLENTWRQGDWITKYKQVPEMIPLKNTKNPTNKIDTNKEHFVEVKRVDRNDKDDDTRLNYDGNDLCNDSKEFVQFERVDYNNDRQNLNDSDYENDITKKHYVELNVCDNDTNTDSYYNDSNDSYDNIDNSLDSDIYITETYYSERLLDDNQTQIVEEFLHNCDMETKNGPTVDNHDKFLCDCRLRKANCEIGCGCVCDNCYSPCWPRDWIKMDFPDARIISINYTSDPYLWRPVWIKGCKRLRLHERADQMMKQLLDLGVGTRPIIWVGHSKGGLFIKQMFTEAYDAYLVANQDTKKENIHNTTLANNEELNHKQTELHEKDINIDITDKNIIEPEAFKNEIANTKVNKDKDIENTDRNTIYKDKENTDRNTIDKDKENTDRNTIDKDKENADRRSDLWLKSAGFMFYSVPHRGSPLADFKTPITARSIELLEMGKDCAVVLSLQQKWLVASNSSKALVTSIVETCKTLMSILWLRIVSVDSADAGIGALYGISVDHREICKPSSRSCVLYKELVDLVHNAMDRWRSQQCGKRQ